MKYQSVMEKVLKKIKPGKKSKVIEQVLEEINEALRENSIKAKAIVGGSFAKNTYLKDKFDVDIFVKFHLKAYKGHALSPLLQPALKRFTPEVIHGSRDYFQFEKDGVSFEVVPVLDIKRPEEADNIMDYSPLHVSWVMRNIRDLQDDVRLAKQFCKACGVYGAESYIRGFSGHTLDILVIHFKGFLNFLKAAAEWGEKVVIDHGNYHKGKALEILNVAKTQSPIVVIDPVFHERNAAANLNTEKFEQFKECTKAFLKNPSEKFFIEKKVDLAGLEKKGAVILTITPRKGRKDVAGSKLLKVYEFINKGLKDYGVIESGWEWDEDATMWFLVEKKELDPTFIHEGPPLEQRPFVAAFKKKHKKTFEEKGKIKAEVKRDCTTIKKCLSFLLRDDYVTERIKKGKIVAL